MKKILSFETSGQTKRVTKRHIPRDTNPLMIFYQDKVNSFLKEGSSLQRAKFLSMREYFQQTLNIFEVTYAFIT
jgi:hypothetical protein